MADEATQRLTILLQARDRDFQRAMDRNNKLMAQVSKQMQGNLDGVAKAFTGEMSRMTMSRPRRTHQVDRAATTMTPTQARATSTRYKIRVP